MITFDYVTSTPKMLTPDKAVKILREHSVYCRYDERTNKVKAIGIFAYMQGDKVKRGHEKVYLPLTARAIYEFLGY